MPFKVTLGCKVKGRFGVLQDTAVAVPSDSADGNKKRKRRVRAYIFGTVIKSLPNQHWRILWHDVNKIADHKPSGNIILVAKRDAKLTDGNLELLDEASKYVGDAEDLKKAISSSPPQHDEPNELLGHRENARRIIEEVARMNSNTSSSVSSAPPALNSVQSEQNSSTSRTNEIAGSSPSQETTTISNSSSPTTEAASSSSQATTQEGDGPGATPTNGAEARPSAGAPTPTPTLAPPELSTVLNEADGDGDGDGDDDDNTNNFANEKETLDPNWIRKEIEDCLKDGSNRHAVLLAQTVAKKLELIEKGKTVDVGGVKWKVRGDVKADSVKSKREF